MLKAHIINYAKTRPVYDAYRKTGYSKHFLEGHRAEITLHKAAKAAFDEANLKKLPKVKELDTEYSKLLTEKKALYPDYRKAKEEMQELLRAKRNVELFFAEEKSSTEKNEVPINEDSLGPFPHGRALGYLFVIKVFGTNAQPASYDAER